MAAYFDVWILKLSGLFPSLANAPAAARPLDPGEVLLFDETRPGFVGAECRRGEVLRLSPDARETLARFLSGPIDPADRPRGLNEIARVTRLARRHFLGHELKSQRVMDDVLG